MKRTSIYILLDPRNQEIRYIGKTIKKLEYRLVEHLCEKSNNKRKAWIRSLDKLGLKPIIEEIDFCDWKESSFWEIHYISLYKSWGCRLTNMTEGGDGALGWKPSKQNKINMSNAQKGTKLGENNPFFGKKHSVETIKLIGNVHRGKIRTQEDKLKQSNTIKANNWKPSENMMLRMIETHGKRVIQLSLDMKFLDKFYTIKEASESIKGKPNGIVKCCKGNLKTYYGFIWMYEEAYKKAVEFSK